MGFSQKLGDPNVTLARSRWLFQRGHLELWRATRQIPRVFVWKLSHRANSREKTMCKKFPYTGAGSAQKNAALRAPDGEDGGTRLLSLTDELSTTRCTFPTVKLWACQLT